MEKENIQPNETVAIGDNINDEAMIKKAGLGVAMGNSTPVIKKIADEIVSTNNEDGVGEAFEKFINIYYN